VLSGVNAVFRAECRKVRHGERRSRAVEEKVAMSALAALLGRSPISLLGCPGRAILRGLRARHVIRPGTVSVPSPACTPITARIPGLARPCARILYGRHRSDTPPGEKPPETRGDPLPHHRALYENPWTIPNLLSMTRIGLSPVLGYLVIGQDFNTALAVFGLAGLTDLLDGYIARNWANQKSALGSALDPLADKILISVLYVCLTCANLIPVPLTIMIILRDIALIAAVFYVRYKTLPPPRTVGKYFNPCYATAQLEPTFISKMNTAVQLILVAASLAAPVFNYVDSVYLQVLW
ncbi:unnamed protein product, partial [Staurois parvus]